VWTTMPFPIRGRAEDVVGVVAGLGFVLSFGYWCTDFMLIQRAMAAARSADRINTRLFAAIAKWSFRCLWSCRPGGVQGVTG